MIYACVNEISGKAENDLRNYHWCPPMRNESVTQNQMSQ
jgi:hypothetical protein